MFCSNCGAQIADGSRFCEHCGTPVGAPQGNPNMGMGQNMGMNPNMGQAAPNMGMGQMAPERPSPNIVRGGDGTYRWIYELSMMSNPVILFTIIKIFFWITVGMYGFLFIVQAVDGNAASFIQDFLLTPQVLILPGILAVLTVISYFIVAANYGWKYIVLFEMNEEGVTHIQQNKQFTKMQGMMWLSAFAGVASGNPAVTVGALNATTKNESSTPFAKVKKVKSKPGLHTINVVAGLEHNQVYAAPEDFAFVQQYIFSHVPATAKKS